MTAFMVKAQTFNNCLRVRKGFMAASNGDVCGRSTNMGLRYAVPNLALEGDVPDFKTNLDFTAIVFNEVLCIKVHGAPC